MPTEHGAAAGQLQQASCEPPAGCAVCVRLADFRADARARWPAWHNGPVRSFGDLGARGLIVGLAPGLKGANRTGRPFTGDYAGDLLYGTLIGAGLAVGEYAADPGDGLELRDVLVTNSVRCVPPENKPTPAEIRACRVHLAATIEAMPRLRAILVLGRIAHESTLQALGSKPSAHPFAHGARSEPRVGLALHASYHCSRYNTQTRRLTTEMFRDVVAAFKADLQRA